jgi:predicted mannosyl-3-phosphoglycerate phosphatase (HAD superfamily)
MFRKVETCGVGDGPNDLSMLKVVDRSFFIKKKVGGNSRLKAWKGILQFISGKKQTNSFEPYKDKT